MKPLFNYIDEAMKAYEIDKRHPRKAGGKFMKAEQDNMTAVFLVFEEPSEEWGIDGGRISKLEIRGPQHEWLCNYDRGWDTKPSDAKVKKFYDEIIKKFN